MTDKDHDKDRAAAEKAAADKREADKREAAKPAAPAAPMTATGGLPPEAYMTEQEKDAANSAKQPYPTGDPPPPSESTTYGQGIKGVTDQPSAKPGSASGPAGQAPKIDEKPRKEKE